VGELSGYMTNDPASSCLMSGTGLTVQPVTGHTNEYLVTATEPGDCVNAVFMFTVAPS